MELLALCAFIFLCAIIQWANTPEPKKSKKTRTKKQNISVIDKSQDMQNTYQYLVAHYLQFLNYPEILDIQEPERLPILKYIWKRWNYRNVLQNLRKKYPSYKKELLETILEIETSRIFVYQKYFEYKQENHNYLVYVSSNIDWRTRYCLIDDIPKVFELLGYETYTNFFLHYDFLKELKTEYVYFFINNDFQQFEPIEFKKFCKQNHYKYPFLN